MGAKWVEVGRWTDWELRETEGTGRVLIHLGRDSVRGYTARFQDSPRGCQVGEYEDEPDDAKKEAMRRMIKCLREDAGHLIALAERVKNAEMGENGTRDYLITPDGED